MTQPTDTSREAVLDQANRMLVEYTNYRGEPSRRVIVPIRFWWGSTDWHPKDQWLLTAYDCGKDAQRDFAWQDMRPIPNDRTSSPIIALLARAEAAEAERDALQAENARLREAMEYIMDGYGLNAPEFKQEEKDENGEPVADDWIVSCIRSALEAKE